MSLRLTPELAHSYRSAGGSIVNFIDNVPVGRPFVCLIYRLLLTNGAAATGWYLSDGVGTQRTPTVYMNPWTYLSFDPDSNGDPWFELQGGPTAIRMYLNRSPTNDFALDCWYKLLVQ